MNRSHWLWRATVAAIVFATAYFTYPYAPGALAIFRFATALTFAGVVLLVNRRNWYFVFGEYLGSAVGAVLFDLLGRSNSPVSMVLGAFVGWIAVGLGLRLALGFSAAFRSSVAQAIAAPASPQAGQ